MPWFGAGDQGVAFLDVGVDAPVAAGPVGVLAEQADAAGNEDAQLVGASPPSVTVSSPLRVSCEGKEGLAHSSVRLWSHHHVAVCVSGSTHPCSRPGPAPGGAHEGLAPGSGPYRPCRCNSATISPYNCRSTETRDRSHPRPERAHSAPPGTVARSRSATRRSRQRLSVSRSRQQRQRPLRAKRPCTSPHRRPRACRTRVQGRAGATPLPACPHSSSWSKAPKHSSSRARRVASP